MAEPNTILYTLHFICLQPGPLRWVAISGSRSSIACLKGIRLGNKASMLTYKIQKTYTIAKHLNDTVMLELVPKHCEIIEKEIADCMTHTVHQEKNYNIASSTDERCMMPNK